MGLCASVANPLLFYSPKNLRMPSLFTGSKYSSLILFPVLHVPLSFQDCGFDREHWNVSPARNASQREAGGDESDEE